YISAKACLNREDPYINAQTLTRRYLSESPITTPDHSSSHTPLSIVMVMPLAVAFTYRHAAIAWCLIEIAIVLFCAVVFWRVLYGRTGWELSKLAALTSLLFLGWGPVKDEIGNGQWTILLLALLLLCWLALRAERSILCGLALGAALAIK